MKFERLTDTERAALLETGHAVHQRRWDAYYAAEQARPSLTGDELAAAAAKSVGSWMEQEENECWARANARRAAERAAGIVPEPPAPPPPTYAQIIAEREAFMAKFIGD